MKDKVKSGLSRIWLLIRLTRITTIVYLLMVTVLFAYMFGVAFSGYSFKVMYRNGARSLFGVIAMLLGCVAGDDAIMIVSRDENCAKSITERFQEMSKQV